MTRGSLRWGAVGAAVLAAFYVTVLTWASGWSHLLAKARQDWWLVVVQLGPPVRDLRLYSRLTDLPYGGR